MTSKIYTFGYSGHKPDQLRQVAEKLEADVFDIRLSPRSRVPHWNMSRLVELLGDRYLHLKTLGNVNYKTGGPIELVNYPLSKTLIERNPRPVILMCACKDYHTCHRQTVAEMLRRDGFEVEELGQLPPISEQDKPGPKKPGPVSIITQMNFFFLV